MAGLLGMAGVDISPDLGTVARMGGRHSGREVTELSIPTPLGKATLRHETRPAYSTIDTNRTVTTKTTNTATGQPTSGTHQQTSTRRVVNENSDTQRAFFNSDGTAKLLPDYLLKGIFNQKSTTTTRSKNGLTQVQKDAQQLQQGAQKITQGAQQIRSGLSSMQNAVSQLASMVTKATQNSSGSKSDRNSPNKSYDADRS